MMGAPLGSEAEAAHYYEDDVAFWRERALRLGELARPMGGFGAAQRASPSGRQRSGGDGGGGGRDGGGRTSGRGGKTVGGGAGGGGGGGMEWDLDRDFTAATGGAAGGGAAEHRGGRGAAYGGAGSKAWQTLLATHLTQCEPSFIELHGIL
jgi:hypothetical protein